MPAYAIFIRENSRSEDEMRTYLDKAKNSGDPFGAKALAFYGRSRTLEGPRAEAVVLLEFPTFEDAEAWYASEDYQGAKVHRHLGADYRAIIVDGIALRK
jgi:uncharacterized protein (DUF1330 family)